MAMKKELSGKGISSRFEREAKIMAGLFFILILIGLVAGWVGPWVLHHLEVDRCLDAGGVFNAETGRCELKNTEKRE
jgi:hypothetical protein